MRAAVLVALLVLAAGAGAAFVTAPATAPVEPTAEATEEFVERRPRWLGAHQAADGRWEAAGFDAWQMGERVPGNDPAGRGHAHNDVAVTAQAVADTQRMDTGICEQRGSWDPLGAWADEGGRVFTTAAGTLILAIYHRYDEVVGAPGDGAGATPAPVLAPPPSPDLPPRRYTPCR